ncbi:MAG TPA: alpha/beta fold hydrolase [Burkholderiales bacterium]|nr:alpha/beta fold hydrolase [Burkholderiales bacterium]
MQREGRPERASEPVVLLHGLWMNRFAMHYLVHALGRAGFRASAMGYRSASETLEQHVTRLARRVAATEGERVHLAGHSLGGLVILRYLQRAPDPRVRRAVLLGAPVSGCLMAERLGSKAAFLLGASASAWRPPLDTSLDARFEVGVVAGTRPFGLARLLVRLPHPSDGVVCLEETRLPGMRDHVTLPVSHSAMLISAQVARHAAAFLREGRFAR